MSLFKKMVGEGNKKLHLLPALAQHPCWRSVGVRDREINQRGKPRFSPRPSACLRSGALPHHPLQSLSYK